MKKMPCNAKTSVAIIIATLIIGPFLAASIAIGQSVPDASFETPAIASDSFTYDPLGAPWSFSGHAGIVNAPGSGFNGPTALDGSQYAFLQSGFSGQTPGVFSQTISFSLAGTFQLTYLVAGRPPDGFGAFGDLPYDVRLDSTVVGTDSTTSSEPFTQLSFTFTAAAGDHTLTFETNQINADNTAFIDSVSIRAVPEPNSFVLFAISGTGLAAAFRFRRAQ